MLTPSGRSYPGVCDLELSEDVLGHVVLRHGINHEVLVPGRALCWPVLVTLFLFREKRRYNPFFTSYNDKKPSIHKVEYIT